MKEQYNEETVPADTKPALVFVHGYLGGSRQWDDQKQYFSRFFHVLTPELPGFGDSHLSTTPDSIRGLATFVLEQIERSRINRFHLVGHSMGGMIAQQMVAQAPGLVDRLVLYSTGADGSMPGRFESIDESREKIEAQGLDKTARQISAAWFVQREAATGYEPVMQLAIMASSQAAMAGLTAMQNWSGVAALGNIKSPTLVLWGDCDQAYPWGQTYQLWEGIEGARLAVVPNCSHAVHAEKPYLFNSILYDFLSSGVDGARL